MDETKFKNHAEKEFWEKAYLSFTSSGVARFILTDAIQYADNAVAARRVRMEDVVAAKRGVREA